ncbi:hypothetical protein LQ567_02385 [Niabella pedocola]|uniref:Uncharacterized protein n=1 Tax=Niabella pedocola TaxID=1752077 RepID=A0ABS8PKR2_9BACT|nr:hypothetical protein [Niabella pedocola]MCD2421591.1 hypothetical protein [Niabella pedocola]
MILRKEIIEQLSKKLSLPYLSVEQDWDIELADKNRIDEFISYYNENDLSAEVKYATMSIILASYEDFLNDRELERDYRWYEIEKILKSGRGLFSELMEYWAVDSEKENIFRIAPLIREARATD